MDGTRKGKRELEWTAGLGAACSGKLRSFFESNVLPLAVWHRDGRIRDANDAYLDLVKYPRRSIQKGGLRCDRLTPAEYLVRNERALRELLQGNSVWTHFQKEYVRGDGARIPVVVGCALLPNSREHGIAFALDLTNYSSAEQALRSRRDTVAGLHASVRGFDPLSQVESLGLPADQTPVTLATLEPRTMLAHEIRQPLGTILANAQAAQVLLRQEKPDIEELKAILRDIIAEDRRASRLIDQFRFSAARAHSPFKLVEINPILRAALRGVRHELMECGIRSETALGSDLPVVRGETGQLHELFINVYSNACEALKQARPAARKLFTRSYSENKSSVSVEIRDSGPGIPPHQLEAIFEPFITTKKGGVGIGLYICRAIVRSHGGQIWATNHPDGGAIFRVSLPAAL